MDNFFNTASTPLTEQYDDLQQNYKQIFIEAAESIRASINKFKPENPCSLCTIKDCKIEKAVEFILANAKLGEAKKPAAKKSTAKKASK